MAYLLNAKKAYIQFLHAQALPQLQFSQVQFRLPQPCLLVFVILLNLNSEFIIFCFKFLNNFMGQK